MIPEILEPIASIILDFFVKKFSNNELGGNPFLRQGVWILNLVLSPALNIPKSTANHESLHPNQPQHSPNFCSTSF